jgi:hypothetical protein
MSNRSRRKKQANLSTESGKLTIERNDAAPVAKCVT